MSVKRGLSSHEVAYIACWHWIGPDPTKWSTILLPYTKSKPVLSDPVGWAKLATPQLLVLRDAVAVPLRESDGEPDVMARSDSGPSEGNYDHGLYQISGRWQFPIDPDWRNPWVNTAMARRAYDAAGKTWTPWSVFTSGLYKERWPDAQIALNSPTQPADWPLPGAPETDPLMLISEQLEDIQNRLGALAPEGGNLALLEDELASTRRTLTEVEDKVSWIKQRFAQT